MKTKLYFFLWVCLSTLLIACEHEESDTSFKGTRTILAYIAADKYPCFICFFGFSGDESGYGESSRF